MHKSEYQRPVFKKKKHLDKGSEILLGNSVALWCPLFETADKEDGYCYFINSFVLFY